MPIRNLAVQIKMSKILATYQNKANVFYNFYIVEISAIFLIAILLKYIKKQRYQDSNLEMLESESSALPFGDSAIYYVNII